MSETADLITPWISIAASPVARILNVPSRWNSRRICREAIAPSSTTSDSFLKVGTETVRAPLHNSHWRPAGLSVVGTQVEGPVYKPTATSFSYPESVYPATREDFASMNSFVDAHFAVEMDEGVVNGQAETMAVLGLLCPDHK